MEPEQQLINIQMTNLELQTLQTHLVNTMGLHNANVALLILQNGLTRGEQSGEQAKRADAAYLKAKE